LIARHASVCGNTLTNINANTGIPLGRAGRETDARPTYTRLAAKMRRKVKFLTVVWGDHYIERFATLALPSFLAPGNLPALAAGSDLEVVILTKRADFEAFDRHPAFRMLHTICPTRFIEIDDLITTGAYGFTLTLAYARAVIAYGDDMLRTHFVFMNADFVLADECCAAF
jgi:hypothetical protein